MRESVEKSKKEIAAENKAATDALKQLKARISSELANGKNVIGDLKAVAKNYAAAKKTAEKKANDKNLAKLDEAAAAYAQGVDRLVAVESVVAALLADVRKNYNVLASNEKKEKIAEKLMAELAEYSAGVGASIEKNRKPILELAELPEVNLEVAAEPEAPAEDAIPEAPIVAVKPEPAAPAPAPAPTPVAESGASASARVAPVQIDVSGIVERAVAATMKKLTDVIDKKLEDYAASHTAAPAAIASASADGVARVAELEAHIFEDEQFLVDKLTAMVDKLSCLTHSIADLTAAYMEISAKQAEVSELQKKTSDTQRHTLREQEGIQVNQRIIAQDQISLAKDQALLRDQQKANTERQAAIVEAQKAMEENQRVVVETQSTLEEAMKSVMQTQKEIIAAQQSIINGNTKNADLQSEISAKQAEALALQREALSAQKQLLRDQKAFNEKQKGGSTTAKKRAAATENSQG